MKHSIIWAAIITASTLLTIATENNTWIVCALTASLYCVLKSLRKEVA